VEARFERTGCILHLHAGGEVIRTTPEHPFYVEDQGWTAAGSLKPGDRLATLSGEWAAVEEVFDTELYEEVYNLRVEEHHTYFVGDENWGWAAWAHNAYLDTLGAWDSPKAEQEFARLFAEQRVLGQANPGRANSPVNEVLLAFMRWAATHYRTLDGRPTTEIGELKLSLRPLRELYGHTPAA
jgi:Pretoxin HINT domain